MSQTFYIESDEEIISVIGRLRTSSAEENIFVFPKRALVLQSIVNLRLFQREAQKLGKKIILVTQDETGKMLAEKAGIRTESYSEDFSKAASHLELVPQSGALDQHTTLSPHSTLRAEAIGSSNFYSDHATPLRISQIPPSPPSAPKAATTLRVRNASPEKLTSLNSRRFEAVTSSMPTPSIPTKHPSLAPVQVSTQASVIPDNRASRPNRDERLKNFYGAARTAPMPAPRTKTSVPLAGKKAHLAFLILGGISLFSLIGAGLFLFLPKAEVHVTPYKMVRVVDIDMDGRIDSVAEDSTTLPVRLLEKEKEVSLTIATTGTAGGINQKARGTVVIYNNYGSDPQPLVATTRLETADGKLFRLTKGVTVPGMTTVGGKTEAGAIEAEVVADQTGAEYNIEASTFIIPGFKGGPKYEKFSAKSTKAMVGGSNGGTADIAAVATVDLDTAEREAKEKAKEAFLGEVRGVLAPDERVLDEYVDMTATIPAALPPVGTAATAFDYRATFMVRAFVFSEKAVRKRVENSVEKEMHGIVFKPVALSVTYNDSVPNFSEKTVRLKAHALVTLESDIDHQPLKAALLGKNEEGIKQALNNFPGVKKINIVFHPELFVKSVPNSEKRVSLIVEPGEEEK